MTDIELANDWLSRTFKDTPLHPQVQKNLEGLLARRALEEARWWHDALKEDQAEISIYLVETFSKRIAALEREQAAGGSAAAKRGEAP